MKERGQTWLENLESGDDVEGEEELGETEAEMECSDKSGVMVPEEYQVAFALGARPDLPARLSCNFARIMRSENSRHEKVGKRRYRYREAVEGDRKKTQFARSI